MAAVDFLAKHASHKPSCIIATNVALAAISKIGQRFGLVLNFTRKTPEDSRRVVKYKHNFRVK